VLFSNASGTPITFTLIIRNTGQADLDVVVSNLPTLLVCSNLFATSAPPTQPIRIVAGGSNVISGCVVVVCPNTVNFNVSVQGTAVANGTNCIFDAAGRVVRTAVSQCSA